MVGAHKEQAREYTVNLYGKKRTVLTCDRVVMLKTLKCAVRVVWVYRRNQWIALFSTDLDLSVEEIIEYYGARWKIEACFKELKRDIGSADTQSRNPVAVTNHLDFRSLRYLHDGHHHHVDLRLSVGKNSGPQTYCRGSQSFCLFRCAKAGGAGGIRPEFCNTLPQPGQIRG